MISLPHLSPVGEPVGFLISLHDREGAIVRVMTRHFASDNFFPLTKKRRGNSYQGASRIGYVR